MSKQTCNTEIFNKTQLFCFQESGWLLIFLAGGSQKINKTNSKRECIDHCKIYWVNAVSLYETHSNFHCVKLVQIRSYFWSVFSCIWTEYRKIRTRNNSVCGHSSRSVHWWQMEKRYLQWCLSCSPRRFCFVKFHSFFWTPFFRTPMSSRV